MAFMIPAFVRQLAWSENTPTPPLTPDADAPVQPAHDSGPAATRSQDGTSRPRGAVYVPFGSSDALHMILGIQQRRSWGGKSGYRVVAKDDRVRDQLERLRRRELEDLRDSLHHRLQMGERPEGVTENDWRDFVTDLQRQTAMFSEWEALLGQMTIHSNESGAELSQRNPVTDKLYVLGHGLPGVDCLSAERTLDAEHLTAEQLAKELAASGLPPASADIRLIACGGADARDPTSFEPDELMAASQPQVVADEGVSTERTEVKRAFAQVLANELKAAGFSKPRVTAYHGYGRVFSPTSHAVRVLPGPPDGPVARASDVRQTFVPERGPDSPSPPSSSAAPSTQGEARQSRGPAGVQV